MGLTPKGLYLSLESEKENYCVVFTYSIKREREIRKFHVAVVQRRLRNVQKSVMAVQSCCFAILTYYFFAVLFAIALVVAQDGSTQYFCSYTLHL